MDIRKRLPRRVLTTVALALTATAIGAVFGVAGNGQAASSAAPSNTSPPTISGTPQEGKTLTADNGKWTGSPTSYSYQWQRCNATGGSCNGISAANRKLYDVVTQDVGNTLRVRVTAKNADGSTSATTVPTAVVTAAAAPPPATGCPTGSGGVAVTQLSAPARLNIDGLTSSPAVIGRTPSTVTLRFHVSACGGRDVSGALVYATAVPYQQFNVPPEATTGSDGWAQLSLSQASRYPASPREQQLTVFVRARKSGEPLLGGISSRRLVSFPVNLSQ
ncbi:MAG TPA: hypothetical protein VGL84_03280 [Gaiellaceae bacterium]|jgi:hypothetical protein